MVAVAAAVSPRGMMKAPVPASGEVFDGDYSVAP